MRLLAVEATARGLGRQELLEREILEIADRERQRLGREVLAEIAIDRGARTVGRGTRFRAAPGRYDGRRWPPRSKP